MQCLVSVLPTGSRLICVRAPPASSACSTEADRLAAFQEVVEPLIGSAPADGHDRIPARGKLKNRDATSLHLLPDPPCASGVGPGHLVRYHVGNRSEEHTSELQSHHDLVCRLLLEKKKRT